MRPRLTNDDAVHHRLSLGHLHRNGGDARDVGDAGIHGNDFRKDFHGGDNR